MSNLLRLPFLLALSFAAAACSVGEFYDKEYVLYDSTPPAAKGSPERAEQDRLAAEAAASAGDPAAPATDLDRVFVLENLRDELDRAIAAGIGDVEALRQKRQDVEREIAWRAAAAGAALEEGRRARLVRLLEYPIVVR